MLLERIDLDDKIEHLFVVDIRFNKEEETVKQYMHRQRNALFNF